MIGERHVPFRIGLLIPAALLCAFTLFAGEVSTVPTSTPDAKSLPKLPVKSDGFEFIQDDEADTRRPLEKLSMLDILEALRNSTPEHLAAHVEKAADFRKLFLHPAEHRGQVVAFTGTYRYRYSDPLEFDDENGKAVKLDRGQISTGGQLISVVSLEPFPETMKPGQPVHMTGIFMKRFAYINDKKPGTFTTLTPLVFVKRLEPFAEEEPSTNTGVFVGYIIFLLVGIGFFLIYSARKDSFVRRSNYFRNLKNANSGKETLFPTGKKGPFQKP